MSGTLRLEGMTVSRGAGPVVRDVTIDIPPGKVTALQDEARDFVWAHTKEVLARAAGGGGEASAAPAGSSP